MLRLKTAVSFPRKTERRVIPGFGCVSSSVLSHLRAPRNKAKTPCCPLLACSHREVAERGEGRLGRGRGPARKPREGSRGAGDPGSFSSQARGTERHIWTQIWLPGGLSRSWALRSLLPFLFLSLQPHPSSARRLPAWDKGSAAARATSEYPGNAGVAHGAHALGWGRKRRTKKPPLSAAGAVARRAAAGACGTARFPRPSSRRLGSLCHLAPARVGSSAGRRPLCLSHRPARLRALLLNSGW